jgi:hypothetical protein
MILIFFKKIFWDFNVELSIIEEIGKYRYFYSQIFEKESKIGQGAYGIYRVSRVDDTLGKQEYVIKNIKLNSFLLL